MSNTSIINKILGKPSKWALDKIICFGKYHGQSVGDVLATDKKYLEWLADQSFVHLSLAVAIDEVLAHD